MGNPFPTECRVWMEPTCDHTCACAHLAGEWGLVGEGCGGVALVMLIVVVTR